MIFTSIEKNQNKHSTLNLSFNALSKWHEPDIKFQSHMVFQRIRKRLWLLQRYWLKMFQIISRNFGVQMLTFRGDQGARICASKMAARKTTKATEAKPAITVYTLGQLGHLCFWTGLNWFIGRLGRAAIIAHLISAQTSPKPKATQARKELNVPKLKSS